MGTLGSLVQNGVDAYNGKASGSTLQDFLSKFSSSAGRYVDTIDPLNTFDIKFQFFPTFISEQPPPDKWDRVLQSLKNSGMKILENTADNLTGGLYSSIMQGGADSVMKKKNEYSYYNSETFLTYLLEANLLKCGEQWADPNSAQYSQLEMSMSMYVQKVTIPNLKQTGSDKSKSYFGEFATNGHTVDSDGSLVMSVINTKAALHERVFYPWMREVTSPNWQYASQPFTTANIIIDFSKHNDVQYVFTGCRPTQINLMQASQSADGSDIVREVTFAYDFMFITSELKVIDDWKSKLLGSASGLASGAMTMMNMTK